MQPLCQAVGPPLRARAEARLPHRLQRHTLLHAEASSFSVRQAQPQGADGRYRMLGAPHLEFLLVARLYKVFLFKSKWPQTSLVASGPWVTMAAFRFRQARAILHGTMGTQGTSGPAGAQSTSPQSLHRGGVLGYPQTRERKAGSMQTGSFLKNLDKIFK